MDSLALNPKNIQTETINFSTSKYIRKLNNRDKNTFYFHLCDTEFRRRYLNNWTELTEYVGLNDIELVDNELVIKNMIQLNNIDCPNYNILRIVSNMGGIAYKN